MRILKPAATAAVACALVLALPGVAQAQSDLFAPGVISSDQQEYRITFTRDGNTAYFTRANGDWFSATESRILVSRRTNGVWGQPTVAPFSGTHKDIDPFITPDGKRLFFATIRSGEDSDLWVVQRTRSGWSEPVEVTGVNGPGNELYPSVAMDGTLYFGSDRTGDWDIYRARLRPDGTYGEPENLGPVINTPGLDFNPEITPDGRVLLFAALGREGQSGGQDGGSDIYVSFQHQGGGWTNPFNLGPNVNTPAWEFHPTLAPRGDRLYFVRITESNDFYSIRLRDLFDVTQ
ncbi:PD40 domain-containing protein [Allorhizocola rhizosphaerae]|uniref:PD40 domain-containing protein n=1 Tax=Allorhizocola rhizosphaerae TaxID=1872709 RepID=UPI000E3E6D3D|nr:PD40 domain-containing protein [Allorhizocola rhizosphaerae]